jgi:hypothetical protein
MLHPDFRMSFRFWNPYFILRRHQRKRGLQLCEGENLAIALSVEVSCKWRGKNNAISLPGKSKGKNIQQQVFANSHPPNY